MSGERRRRFVRWGAAAACAAAAVAVGVRSFESAPRAGTVAVRRDLAKLPLVFEANRGQTDAAVRFSARCAGTTLWLADREAVFGFASGKDGMDVLRMSFVAGAATAPEGRAPRASHSRYCRAGGETVRDVPHFGEVVERGVWPGVDVRWHGEHGKLEYDVVVAPGVDPSVVRVALKGADGLRVREDGALAVSVGGREVVQEAPVAYQTKGELREPVAAAFELNDGDVVFRLGAYDASRPLVVDPTVAFGTYVGGSGDETANGIAVDPVTSAAVVCGGTTSVDFPTGFGHVPTAPKGGTDAYVLKLDPTGLAVQWAVYLAGTDYDEAFGVAIDPATRNVWVCGQTHSTNFPTFTPSQADNAGGWDGFLAELDGDGTAILFCTYIGGSGDDFAREVAVGEGVYVTGFTNSTDYPLVDPTQGIYGGGLHDGFLTSWSKTDPSGGPQQSTYVGGSGDDLGAHVGAIAGSTTPGSPGTVDLITNGSFEDGGGSFSGWGTTDLQSPASALSVQAVGYAGDFFSVVPTDGTHAAHSGFGSVHLDEAGTITIYQDVQVPPSSDEGALNFDWHAAWALSGFQDRTFDVQIQPIGGGDPLQTIPVLTAHSPPPDDVLPISDESGSESFSLDLTPYAGSGFRVAFVLTVPQDVVEVEGFDVLEAGPGGAQIQIDDVHLYAAKGGVVVVGRTNSLDFPRTDGSVQTQGGSTDVFVSQYGRDGTTSGFSGVLGGKGEDDVADVAFSPNGDIAVCGRTNSFDFPRVLALQGERQGPDDAFVAKITNGGSQVEFATYFGGGRQDEAIGCAIDPTSGDVYVVGRTNSLDFPRSGDALQIQLGDANHFDGFLARFGTIVNAFGVSQPGTLLYSSYLGGPDDDALKAVAISAGGSAVFVAGDTRSAADMPVVAAVQPDLFGESDAFVAKLNGSGIFAAGNLVADARSPDTVALEWKTRPTLATRLVVERTAVGGKTAAVATLAPTATSYVDTGLVADSSYSYSVVAVDPDGTKTPSNAAGARTLPYPPAAPTDLVAVAAGARVSLTWTDASINETGFDVQRLKGGAFASVAHVPSDATRWDATLVASAPLDARWRVVAVNRGGSSAPSNEVATTTTPTLSMKLLAGSLQTAKGRRADRFAASGTIAGAAAFDPNVQAVRIELGDPADPLVLALPAGVRGWSLRRGAYTFSSAKSFVGGARFHLTLDVARGTFSLTAAGFEFPKPPAGDVWLGFALGGEAGAVRSTWRQKGEGRLTAK